MAGLVKVREVAGSWSYTVIPDGQVVGAYGWAESEADAWAQVSALLGEPTCDTCGVVDEDVAAWCGSCGMCAGHCRGWEGC
jgi:hypothetical protein